MKLLIYIPVLSVGGAEKVVIRLSRELSFRGNILVYLITDLSESKWLGELSSNVHLIHLDSKANLIIKLFRLRNVLRLGNYDVVMSHLTHSNVQLSILKLTLFFKLILVEHSVTSKYIDSLGSIRSGLFNLLIRSFYKYAERIICVSELCKEDLIDKFGVDGRKLEVVYNPIDFTAVLELSKFEVPSHINEFLAGSHFIISIGRLEREKNHLWMLKNISPFLKTYNLKLLIVGDGSERINLLRYITDEAMEEYVLVLGFDNNPYKYLSKAKLLIHPSMFEGFGLVLIEAIFLGVPVVSFKFDSTSEIIIDSSFGETFTDRVGMLCALEVFYGSNKSNTISEIFIKSSLFKRLNESISRYSTILNEVIEDKVKDLVG